MFFCFHMIYLNWVRWHTSCYLRMHCQFLIRNLSLNLSWNMPCWIRYILHIFAVLHKYHVIIATKMWENSYILCSNGTPPRHVFQILCFTPIAHGDYYYYYVVYGETNKLFSLVEMLYAKYIELFDMLTKNQNVSGFKY